MGGVTKNEQAWQAIFDRHGVLDRVAADGRFVITADRIREFREPRLMAKFDHRLNLPEIFRENRLSILPVSRGEYVISQFDCYQPLPPADGEIRRAAFPDSIQSIDPYSITGEAMALHCALASGVFADFLGDGDLVPTVSGRMGSGVFDFRIFNAAKNDFVNVSVNNAQIEIDFALEGRSSLALVEAKCDLSDDFIIRQLYYPFRTWERRVAKRVRPVYLVFTNGIFTLYEYEFADAACYNSPRLVRSRRYSVEDTGIGLADIDALAAAAPPSPEPAVAFPQADSFDRVVNLLELLRDNPLDRDDVTCNYDFDVRQTDYYTTACRYLGLAEKDASVRPVRFSLTEKARRILALRYRRRQLKFCECILGHRIFRDVYLESRRLGRVPDVQAVAEMMKAAGLYNVRGESTYRRRASTVRGWVEWMLGLCRSWGGRLF